MSVVYYEEYVVISKARLFCDGVIQFVLITTTDSGGIAQRMERHYLLKKGESAQDFAPGGTMIWKVCLEKDSNQIKSIKRAGYNCNIF